MRIGVDFDDTLTDFSGLFTRLARERCGVDFDALRQEEGQGGLQPYDVCAVLPEPARTRLRDLIRELLATDLTLQMEPSPGAVEVTRRLARDHELVVVTARSDEEARAARTWLQGHGIRPRHFVTTNREPKAAVAGEHGLAVLLDDAPATFDHFVDHPTVAALYLRSWTRLEECAAHVHPIEHWHRFEALVDALAARRAGAITPREAEEQRPPDR